MNSLNFPWNSVENSHEAPIPPMCIALRNPGAGSSSAWSMASSRTDRCPATRPSAAGMLRWSKCLENQQTWGVKYGKLPHNCGKIHHDSKRTIHELSMAIFNSELLNYQYRPVAQGGGGSFKNRKPIGEIGCCESGMAERIHWWTERCLRSPLFSLSFSDYLLTYQPIFYVSIYPSIHPSIHLSICLSVCLSVYLSICLSVYLSTCLSVVQCHSV